MTSNDRILVKLYLVNLIGWIIGIFLGFYLEPFYLFPNLDLLDFELAVSLLTLSVCTALVQFLVVRSLKPKFNIFTWVIANVKGAFLAFVIVALIGAILGAYQDHIWRFFYNYHLDIGQTHLILSLIYVMVPLLGSISTSTMVSIDIFKWEFGKV